MGKDESQICGPDPRANLEAKRGTSGFDFAVLSLTAIQRSRDQARNKAAARSAVLAALPSVQRKREVAREVIETGDATSEARNIGRYQWVR
ncbi:hypothetical protein V5F63_26330 [Xanthobacter autotrophicus DSM 597]|uniref:hypothetical protein n=1 Tax=Xanthobacter wiegelii TaxID=3119913 RepID=UPI00372B77CB